MVSDPIQIRRVTCHVWLGASPSPLKYRADVLYAICSSLFGRWRRRRGLFSLSSAAALIVVVILKHATLRICSNARPRTAAFRSPTSVTAWTTAEIRLTNETAVSKFVFSLLLLLALCLTKRIVVFIPTNLSKAFVLHVMFSAIS